MKPKVAFVCVHNSCRSQIAEALSNHLASDVFEAYSGGTETKDEINQDAARVLQDSHDIDMSQEGHRPKLISELPKVDIVVKMGCNVGCPFLSSKHTEDWGLDDPSGKSDEEFEQTIRMIEEKVINLRDRISSGDLDSKLS